MRKPEFDWKREILLHKNALVSALVCLALVLVIVALVLFAVFKLGPSDSSYEETEKSELNEEEKVSVIKKEIRGVYIASVHNINFPSAPGKTATALQAELDNIVAECSQTGFNTIYFQVRPSADSLYESDLFPASRFLVASEGDPLPLDPLAYLIEKAGEQGIDVVAWVNPYRVTTAKFDTKEEALSSLSLGHPARENPHWTFLYDGKLYFNPGVPEVRELIVSGVKEICSSYDVAGILFDDYFYPYPINGQEIEDSETYHTSRTKLSLSDWRRENVNLMIKNSYETVKSVSPDLSFGVSPFGIWQNESSHEEGSKTAGLESYSALYCDSLTWVEEGWVDYISPQLYWSRDNSAASFEILASWWNEKLKGTGVKLVISHGAYRASEYSEGGEEIAWQIKEGREYSTSCGSIQYGYADF